MSDTLFLLGLEHQRIAKLLKVMEEQLEILEEGDNPDHGLLQSMLAYLSGYPLTSATTQKKTCYSGS